MGASCHEEGPRNLRRGEALLPAPDAGLGLGRLAHDRPLVPKPSTVREHDLRPPDVLLRRVSVFNARSVKPIEIGGRDGKRNAGSHPPDPHAATQPGIRLGIQLSDLIH